MILYLDSSALVKLYVSEAGSRETAAIMAKSESVATVAISRVEVSAALARSVRMGALSREDAEESLQRFRRDWPNLQSIRISDELIAQADSLAWQYNLRAYDSVQLTAGLLWQNWMEAPVTFATFDSGLWKAAREDFEDVFPSRL